MNWFTDLFSKKKKEKLNKNNGNGKEWQSLYARIDYLLQQTGKNKNEATLEAMEEMMKNLLQVKEDLLEKFERDSKMYQEQVKHQIAKFKEETEKVKQQEQHRKLLFQKQMSDAENIQNQLLLHIDFYRREIEISRLEKGLSLVVLPSERDMISKKITELNRYNVEIEEMLKRKQIDAETVKKIREKLGSLENKSNNKKDEDAGL